MNKIAEIMYGKVANIYETSRTLEEMRTLFVPAALLVDVTNIEDVGVGYAVDYGSGLETPNFIPPPKILPQTLEEAKAAKLAALKAERDNKEVEPIEYNGSSFDYDEKARDRINAAIIALEVAGESASLEWTAADNTDVTVTAADLKGIISAVAVRSNALHVAYRAAKEQVEAAESKEEVEAIELD